MFASDLVKQQLSPTSVLLVGINFSSFLQVSGAATDGSPQGISPYIVNHSGLRMIDPPFTAVKQSIGLAKGKAESIAVINTLIARSIKNGWITAQLKSHGMTGKLAIDPH